MIEFLYTGVSYALINLMNEHDCGIDRREKRVMRCMPVVRRTRHEFLRSKKPGRQTDNTTRAGRTRDREDVRPRRAQSVIPV